MSRNYYCVPGSFITCAYPYSSEPSRRLTRDFYSVTVGFNVFTVSTLLSKSTVFSPTFRAGFTFISLALQNIMTCRVFRLLRLGLIHNNPAGQLATLEFTSDDDPDNSREMRVLSLRRRDNEGCGESSSGHSNMNHV